MINITNAEDYRLCNICGEKNNVYNLTFRYKGTNTGTQIAVCRKCIGNMVDIIQEAGVVQLEVTRCIDCEHCTFDAEFGKYWCNRTSGVFQVRQNDFCSWAKKGEK